MADLMMKSRKQLVGRWLIISNACILPCFIV